MLLFLEEGLFRFSLISFYVEERGPIRVVVFRALQSFPVMSVRERRGERERVREKSERKKERERGAAACMSTA